MHPHIHWSYSQQQGMEKPVHSLINRWRKCDTIYKVLFSHKKKKPFLTTWMSFEDIILNEIIWIEKTNIVWSHIQSTKCQSHQKQRVSWWLSGSGALGKMGRWWSKRLLTSIYKVSSKDLMYSMVTIINTIMLYFEIWNSGCSHHTYTHKW